MAKNVTTTNKDSEADFGIIDLLIRTKPNLSCQGMFAFIMWSKNETIEWMDNLDGETKTKYMDDARKRYPETKRKFDERKKVLKEKKFEMVIKKQNELKEKEIKAGQKKVEAVNELVTLGIQAWLSEEQVEDNLVDIPDEEDKVKVLLAQLNFYKHVISVKCPAHLFYKTKIEPVSNKRINRDSNELLDSLLQVLKHNLIPSTYERPSSFLKGKNERDKAFAEGKEELTKKMLEARMKRFTSKQAKEHLPMLLQKPELLVGKRVHHLLDDEGSENWQAGTVLCIQKHNKNRMRVVYSIAYTDDPDILLSFPLLVDLKKGDLIIEGDLNT